MTDVRQVREYMAGTQYGLQVVPLCPCALVPFADASDGLQVVPLCPWFGEVCEALNGLVSIGRSTKLRPAQATDTLEAVFF